MIARENRRDSRLPFLYKFTGMEASSESGMSAWVRLTYPRQPTLTEYFGHTYIVHENPTFIPLFFINLFPTVSPHEFLLEDPRFGFSFFLCSF
jgi:hypothetical protein